MWDPDIDPVRYRGCGQGRPGHIVGFRAQLPAKGAKMQGIARATPISPVSIAMTREVADFDPNISEVRDSPRAPATCEDEMCDVTEFRVDRFGAGLITIATLGPSDVENFVQRLTRGLTPNTFNGL
ncbi:hypothetical protein SAMN05446935_7711 [Burkholderia sp. YR290]|nr:hypothetical protein SAMN05446935_7711 [Burkholderia sp. YR290]